MISAFLKVRLHKLLDTGPNLLPDIVVKRRQALVEQVAFEMQRGSRTERGATDGLFGVMMGLKKRQ